MKRSEVRNSGYLLGLAIASLAVGLVLNACGVIQDPRQDEAQEVIDGTPVGEYYSQFYASHGADLCGSEPISENHYYKLGITLNDDHSYQLSYKEFDRDPSSDGSVSPQVDYPMSGTWEIQGTHLVFSDVGQGAGVRARGEQAVALMIDKTSPLKKISAVGMPILSRCPKGIPLE